MTRQGLEAGATGSTGVIQAPTIEERRETPQNSFLRFVNEKGELFTSFSTGVRRLREEEQAWRNSPRLVGLLDEVVKIIRDGSSRTFDPKKEQEFRRRYAGALLGDTESPISGDDIIQFRRGLLPPYGIKWDEWGVRADQFAQDYRAVRKPIREAALEAKQALLDQFAEYLKAEFKHLFDFRDFLTDSKLASVREGIRPFLMSLAEHVFKTREKDGNMLAQLHREWSDKTKGDVLDEIFESFWPLSIKIKRPGSVKSIKKEGDRTIINVDRRLFEFLLFSTLLVRQIRRYKNITPDTPEEEITDEDLCYALKQIPLSEWPESLRNDYQRFAAATVASVIDGIRKGLEPYRRFS